MGVVVKETGIRTAVDISPVAFTELATTSNKKLSKETRKTRRWFLKLSTAASVLGAFWGASSFIPDVYSVADYVFLSDDRLEEGAAQLAVVNDKLHPEVYRSFLYPIMAVKIADLKSDANIFVSRSGLGLIQYLEAERAELLGQISNLYRCGSDTGINPYSLYNSVLVARRGNNLESYTIRHPDLHKVFIKNRENS